MCQSSSELYYETCVISLWVCIFLTVTSGWKQIQIIHPINVHFGRSHSAKFLWWKKQYTTGPVLLMSMTSTGQSPFSAPLIQNRNVATSRSTRCFCWVAWPLDFNIRTIDRQKRSLWGGILALRWRHGRYIYPSWMCETAQYLSTGWARGRNLWQHLQNAIY